MKYYKVHLATALFLSMFLPQYSMDNGLAISRQTTQLQENFFRAAAHCKIDEMKKYLDEGADVNAQGHYGSTALHMVLSFRPNEDEITTDQDIIKQACNLLIAHNADVNAQDNGHDTPLHLATKYGDTNIIRTLIEHGANVNVLNMYKENALHNTAKELPVGTPFFYSMLAAMEFAITQAKENMRLLVEHGTKIDQQCSYGFYPLNLTTYASYREFQDIHEKNMTASDRLRRQEPIQNLIDDGIQLPVLFEHASYEQRKQLLPYFCIYMHLYHNHLLQEIIPDHTPFIPACWIIYATRCGHGSVVDKLTALQHIRDDVNNVSNEHGERILHIAAQYNRPQIFSRLLPLANPNKFNGDGETAYSVAKKHAHKPIKNILAKKNIIHIILQKAKDEHDNHDIQDTEKPQLGRLPNEVFDHIAKLAVSTQKK